MKSSRAHHLSIIFLLLLFPQMRVTARPEFTLKALAHNDHQLLSSRTGDGVISLWEIKNHLRRFGYMSQNLSEADDRGFQSAISRYQTRMGLQMTGKLDAETISQILVPRCGVPDDAVDARGVRNGSSLHARKKYVYFPGKPRWARGSSPMTLTYAFSRQHMITYLRARDIGRAFRSAFSRWASVIPVSFVETTDYGAADITIGFYGGDHGDGQPFDGVLGVLAHSFSPESGRLHLDEAERWAVDFDAEESPVAVDLESVAVHEIGHVLGLGHSSVKEAVMYPSLKPRGKKLKLAMDDVVGVQALYGTNPNFTFGASLESYVSAKGAVGRRFKEPSRLFLPSVVLSFLFLMHT